LSVHNVVCGQFEVVSSVEELHEYVDKDSLPSSLGGTVDFSQSAWLAFQQVCLVTYEYTLMHSWTWVHWSSPDSSQPSPLCYLRKSTITQPCRCCHHFRFIFFHTVVSQ